MCSPGGGRALVRDPSCVLLKRSDRHPRVEFPYLPEALLGLCRSRTPQPCSTVVPPDMWKPDSQTNRRVSAIALGLALSVVLVARAQAVPGVPELSVSVVPAEVTYGRALTVTGRVLDAGQGVSEAPLTLQANSYPFGGFVTVARLRSAADGSFAFSGVKPNRNTRLRVVEEGLPGATSAVLPVIVDPNAAINAVSLGRGLTRLSLRVGHTPQGESASVRAWWFVAARGTRVFHLAAVTPTRELSPGVTYASATVDPPSKRFTYRVCVNPTWEHAMGAPASHGRCPEHDYTASNGVG